MVVMASAGVFLLIISTRATDYEGLMLPATSFAVRNGDVTYLRTILQDGMSPNARVKWSLSSGVQGLTLLMLACNLAQLDVVKLLLEHGADVNLRDELGADALWYATYSVGHDRKKQGGHVIAALLEAGATLAPTGTAEKTAIAQRIITAVSTGASLDEWLDTDKHYAIKQRPSTSAGDGFYDLEGSPLPPIEQLTGSFTGQLIIADAHMWIRPSPNSRGSLEIEFVKKGNLQPDQVMERVFELAETHGPFVHEFAGLIRAALLQVDAGVPHPNVRTKVVDGEYTWDEPSLRNATISALDLVSDLVSVLSGIAAMAAAAVQLLCAGCLLFAFAFFFPAPGATRWLVMRRVRRLMKRRPRLVAPSGRLLSGASACGLILLAGHVAGKPVANWFNILVTMGIGFVSILRLDLAPWAARQKAEAEPRRKSQKEQPVQHRRADEEKAVAKPKKKRLTEPAAKDKRPREKEQASKHSLPTGKEKAVSEQAAKEEEARVAAERTAREEAAKEAAALKKAQEQTIEAARTKAAAEKAAAERADAAAQEIVEAEGREAAAEELDHICARLRMSRVQTAVAEAATRAAAAEAVAAADAAALEAPVVASNAASSSRTAEVGLTVPATSAAGGRGAGRGGRGASRGVGRGGRGGSTAADGPISLAAYTLESSPPVAPPPESTIGGQTTCIVCFEGEKTHLNAACGHQCVCETCAAMISECPCCRVAVDRWIRVRVM